jgi:hypothetical protein
MTVYMTGTDSYGSVSGAALAANGYGFACRYLSYDPAKNLTAGEAEDIMAYATLVLNWESTGYPGNGFTQGVADAQEAQRQATALGLPNAPIYFSIDYDATPRDQPIIDAYFAGVASVLGLSRVGAYGGYWVIKRLFDTGRITFGWQTQAWSGTNVDPRIHILQINDAGYAYVGGTQCDLNQALQPYVGQNPSTQTKDSVRRRGEDNTMELPPTDTRIDKQIPTDIVGGWCGAANLLLIANTDDNKNSARVYGIYAVADRGSTPPDINTLLSENNGHVFTQWWPGKYSLPAGTTSVIINYAAPTGMVARIEYER